MTELLQVEDLCVSFSTDNGLVRAVRGVTFSVRQGEIFGIVGETGCGKTVTALSILRLLPATARVRAKRLELAGQDLLKMPESRMAEVRGRQVGMVFQDPSAALNPLFTIGEQIRQVIIAHLSLDKEEVDQRIWQLLHDVGLPNPDSIRRCYPHQLSGGMQQRVMIALALAAEPALLIADEPTTALDVTIQAQILDLLLTLRSNKGVTILLITHNLGVVAEICDRVAVFYAGQVVEVAEVHDLYRRPLHPYTYALLAAVPKLASDRRELQVIPGAVPTGIELLPGCGFAPRCRLAGDRCSQSEPGLREVGPGHLVACWRAVG